MFGKRSLIAATGLVLGLGATGAMAAQYEVTVQNLTRGIYLTPLLVAAHDSNSSVFTAGSAASTNLQAMAEGGDISGLSADLNALGATIEENPAGGLLAPGAETTAMLDTDSAPANTQLSIVAMMLPTNDGFIGLNAADLPDSGSQSYYVNAYDAGTEGNDEVRGSGTPGMAGFPVPGPIDSEIDSGGSGRSASAEGHVHIHPGNLGDTDASGGVSDIDSTRHRWLNPVVRVTVTVQ